MKKISFFKIIIGLLLFLVSNSELKGQTLSVFIEEALNNNPEIRKYKAQYEMFSEKENEVGALPNTDVSMGVFVSKPETRTGAQSFKFSVKQMLPWFGTITARENYAKTLAESEYQEIVIAKRKLIASVSKSYYELYNIQDKQKIVEQQIDLLKTYEQWALKSVEVGKASVVDVLKIQIRQNDLQLEKNILQQRFIGEQGTINKLLNRDISTAIKIIDSLLIPEREEALSIGNMMLHPELMKYDKLYESIEKSELVNQKERQPMIGFGLDYVNIQKRPDMTFSDNGKDILMPMVSFSIPLFRSKHKSITRQNKWKKEKIDEEKLSRYNVLETLLQKAITNRTSFYMSYKTQLKNFSKVEEVETILIKKYETGSIDFKDLLDLQELKLKLQVGIIESKTNYYVQSSIINYLVQ